MPLVKRVKQVDGKLVDKRIINKTNNAITTKSTIKGNKNIFSTISSIVSLVDTKLGHYKEKYRILINENGIQEYFCCIAKNKVCAIDTETTGLNPILDEIVGICLYTPDEKPVYIPYGHISYITGEKIKNQPDKDFLVSCFNFLADKDIKWIFHNAKFDIRFLKNQLGVELHAYWDTMIASKCIDETEPAGLKELHLKYCNSEDNEAMTFSKLFESVPFSLIPINVAYLYAAGDAIKTYELYKYQQTILNRQVLTGPCTVFKEIEMPLIDVVAGMEDTGVKIDTEYVNTLSTKYHKMLEEQEKVVYDTLNIYEDKIREYKIRNPDNKLSEPINISSPAQLSILLYDILGVPVVDKKTPRGTGEDILKKIDNPICEAILTYRGINKLVTTYIDVAPTYINPKTGRVHCSFHQYGTRTGRMSSSDFNLQNLPSHNKDIRKMFVAKEGCCFVGADFS